MPETDTTFPAQKIVDVLTKCKIEFFMLGNVNLAAECAEALAIMDEFDAKQS